MNTIIWTCNCHHRVNPMLKSPVRFFSILASHSSKSMCATWASSATIQVVADIASVSDDHCFAV